LWDGIPAPGRWWREIFARVPPLLPTQHLFSRVVLTRFYCDENCDNGNTKTLIRWSKLLDGVLCSQRAPIQFAGRDSSADYHDNAASASIRWKTEHWKRRYNTTPSDSVLIVAEELVIHLYHRPAFCPTTDHRQWHNIRSNRLDYHRLTTTPQTSPAPFPTNGRYSIGTKTRFSKHTTGQNL
jgi:hypothetical protein